MSRAYFPKVHREDGVSETWLRSWTEFHRVVGRLLRQPDYVFRGQRDARWLVESSLTRLVRSRSKWRLHEPLYMTRFRMALRGRLDEHLLSSLSDDEILAIGQHFGMATPLLDWSTSPYVGLFFAFESPTDSAGHRAVFALHEGFVRGAAEEAGRSAVSFVRPKSGFNKRLVHQAGLFTKGPLFNDIQSWVEEYFENLDEAILIKINIPSTGRHDCLRALNKMNINHATLFPDVDGSARFCNLHMEIANY